MDGWSRLVVPARLELVVADETLKPVALVLDVDCVRQLLDGDQVVVPIDPVGVELRVSVRDDNPGEAAGLARLLALDERSTMH